MDLLKSVGLGAMVLIGGCLDTPPPPGQADTDAPGNGMADARAQVDAPDPVDAGVDGPIDPPGCQNDPQGCDAPPPKSLFVAQRDHIVADLGDDGIDDLVLFGTRAGTPELRVFAGIGNGRAGGLFDNGPSQTLATGGAVVVAADDPRIVGAMGGAFVALARDPDGSGIVQTYVLIDESISLFRAQETSIEVGDAENAFARLLRAGEVELVIAGTRSDFDVVGASGDPPSVDLDSGVVDLVRVSSGFLGASEDFVAVSAFDATWYPYDAANHAYEGSFESVPLEGFSLVRFGDIDDSGTLDALLFPEEGNLSAVLITAPFEAGLPGELTAVSSTATLSGPPIDAALAQLGRGGLPDLVTLVMGDAGPVIEVYADISVFGEQIGVGAVTRRVASNNFAYDHLAVGNFDGSGSDEIYVFTDSPADASAPPQCFVLENELSPCE